MKRRATNGKVAANAKVEKPALTCSIEQWSSQIRSVWARGAANTLELARVVCYARQRLPYGAWARMWSPSEMPFSKRKADKLVSIGQHLGRLDENICSHLPTRWSILYCLSRLGAAAVERCINEGTIHPGLTLREAKELLAKHRGKQRQPKRLNVGLRLHKFRAFVLSTMNEWTYAERGLVCTELTELAGQITEHDRGDRFDHLPNRENERPAMPAGIAAFATAEPNRHHRVALF